MTQAPCPVWLAVPLIEAAQGKCPSPLELRCCVDSERNDDVILVPYKRLVSGFLRYRPLTAQNTD